jgi:hypothetical protein
MKNVEEFVCKKLQQSSVERHKKSISGKILALLTWISSEVPILEKILSISGILQCTAGVLLSKKKMKFLLFTT